MTLEMRGKKPDVVIRDKHGNKISAQQLEKLSKEKEQEGVMEWGKGLVQMRDKEKQALEFEHEKRKPMAR